MTVQKITDWAPTDRLTILAVRFALGAGFLSAVVDRFGGWGAYGERNVSWGDFAHFIVYSGAVNSFLPNQLLAPTAWIATIAEALLGIALILGLYTRWTAICSGLLLGAFALAMSISLGIKAPLNYSVFTASAAAFLLANGCAARDSSVGKVQRQPISMRG